MIKDAEYQSSGDLCNTRSISDMCRLHKVTARTLRFYEERDLLSPMRIGLSRYYSIKDEMRLKLIKGGKQLGFSLNEIEAIIGKARGPRGNLQLKEDFVSKLDKRQIQAHILYFEETRTQVVEDLECLYKVQNRHE